MKESEAIIALDGVLRQLNRVIQSLDVDSDESQLLQNVKRELTSIRVALLSVVNRQSNRSSLGIKDEIEIAVILATVLRFTTRL